MSQALLRKAGQSLGWAHRALEAGDTGLASNRAYYACFYAASAVLLTRQLVFSRHTGVRAAVHQHLVRAGLLTEEMGRFYDRAFADRQEADYNVLAVLSPEVVEGRIGQAERFVACMKALLPADNRTWRQAEVAVSPGRAFGDGGEGWLRIALVEYELRLRQAMRQIDRAMRKGGG